MSAVPLCAVFSFVFQRPEWKQPDSHHQDRLLGSQTPPSPVSYICLYSYRYILWVTIKAFIPSRVAFTPFPSLLSLPSGSLLTGQHLVFITTFFPTFLSLFEVWSIAVVPRKADIRCLSGVSFYKEGLSMTLWRGSTVPLGRNCMSSNFLC